MDVCFLISELLRYIRKIKLYTCVLKDINVLILMFMFPKISITINQNKME
jgi:hypothetical protein